MRTGKGKNVSCDHLSPAMWRALEFDLQAGCQRWEIGTWELHAPGWESWADGKGTVGRAQEVNKNVSGVRGGPAARVEQVLGQICEVKCVTKRDLLMWLCLGQVTCVLDHKSHMVVTSEEQQISKT